MGDPGLFEGRRKRQSRVAHHPKPDAQLKNEQREPARPNTIQQLIVNYVKTDG